MCSYKFRKIHRKTIVPEPLKKETLEQVFSCEFCVISKNTFSYRTHLVAASVKCLCEFQNDFILPLHTLQTAILGLSNEANNDLNLLNHTLLIFKYYIYMSREKVYFI